MDQFDLVQAVDCFSQGIVVTVPPTADRRLGARLGQAFAVADGRSEPFALWPKSCSRQQLRPIRAQFSLE